MSDTLRVLRVAMASLVQSYGCLDAVAETIGARWGSGVSKGTLSRALAGNLDWTLAHVVALEDAAGRYPVTRLLARRLTSETRAGSGSLVQDGACIAREAGEAVAAILSAESIATSDHAARAVVEIDEAIEALQQARARLLVANIPRDGGDA